MTSPMRPQARHGSNRLLLLTCCVAIDLLLSTAMNPITPPGTHLPLPQTTPVKIKSSTTLPYTTNQKYCVESSTTMGEEIKKYLVGPLPAQQLLDFFFLVSELPDLGVSLFTPGCYQRTVTVQNETCSYEHFVSFFQ